MGLEQLSDRYAEHNRVERGAGFVVAGPERVELFRRYVGGPGRHVLDLGCRDGALTQAYAGGNEVVGVDADREALAEAQKLGIETRWADLDDALPFEDGCFDVVVAGELLEHLRDPRRGAAGRRRSSKSVSWKYACTTCQRKGPSKPRASMPIEWVVGTSSNRRPSPSSSHAGSSSCRCGAPGSR